MTTKGNFSKDPAEVLADATTGVLADGTKKNYAAVHVEQGVPVLDRDLNLLGDLISSRLRRVVQATIGDGVVGANDLTIGTVSSTPYDFVITGGTCIVQGYDVTLPSAGIRYSTQNPAPPSIAPPGLGTRTDVVWLDIWLEETDETGDPTLANGSDVGMRTSTRLQVRSYVRALANAQDPPPPPAPPPQHYYFPISRVVWLNGIVIAQPDLRARCVSMPAVTALLAGLQSTLERELATLRATLETEIGNAISSVWSQLSPWLTIIGNVQSQVSTLQGQVATLQVQVQALQLWQGSQSTLAITRMDPLVVIMQPGQSQSVSIYGNGFSDPTLTVTLNSLPPLQVTSATPEQCTVSIPPGTPSGTYTVSVATSTMAAVSSTQPLVLVLPPLFDNIPQIVPTGGNMGGTVTLYGHNFDYVTSVYFGMVTPTRQPPPQLPAQIVSVSADHTQLIVTVPTDMNPSDPWENYAGGVDCLITVVATLSGGTYPGAFAGQATTTTPFNLKPVGWLI